jgi:hypothetical protein
MSTPASQIRPRSTPRALLCSVVLAMPLVLAGCSTYYRVSDTAGTKEYFTKKIDRERGGAIRFTDARTGSEVTMQSSEVTKISEKDFKASVDAKK